MHNAANVRHLREQNSDFRFYFPGLSDIQVNTDHLREVKAELPDPLLLFPLPHNLTHPLFSKSQEDCLATSSSMCLFVVAIERTVLLIILFYFYLFLTLFTIDYFKCVLCLYTGWL